VRLDQSRPYVGDMLRRSRLSGKVLIEKSNRCIGVRHFANPEDNNSRASEVAKSREVIRTIHLEGMHGSDLNLRERSQ
jgi:hypothetical protein